ncbi:hypothetical protein SAMN05421505_10589 [Sinosporangium album]|uniref:Uncharacterized protein n=1 Tax=Sinosporangium album TaxID=504805 RepID=A0A1G7V2Y3_9ACTN|nr:hypothetical protein [Sinosporangium album]SDG54104.1 hypothetical protein SAMN05421505_10589 [Sinosporangium album]
MYVDPPAPLPRQPGEEPPGIRPNSGATGPRNWQFNPEYQKLVVLWFQVMPLLDTLAASLDKATQAAKSSDTWDAPVGERYVNDMAEWRNKLLRYRQSVLTAISDEAADTPRWVPREVSSPHAFS